MVIYIKDVVNACDTNAQGDVIFRLASARVASGQAVTLDFSGILNVTSSFTNSALVELADRYGIDAVRKLVVLRSVNRQISNMVKSRLSRQLA